jgi:hypothetical protein
MDDSIFAKLGYDPVRIFAHFHGQPAPGGIARFAPASAPVEVKGEDAAPAADAQAPPPEGEGDPRQGGGGAPEGDPALAGCERPDVPLHPPADSPTPRAGEELDPAEAERRKLIRAWLDEHCEIVEAMARAGEAPVRAAPPPEPEPEPSAEPPPRPHVARGDRWTKPKMAEFLRQLAATHSVTAAARAVGMSRNSAYKLRTRLKGQPFDIAWEAAFRHGYDDLAHAALELALEGEEVPHYYKGELKATHRKRSPQLMVQLLKLRNRAGAPMLGRYGAAAEFWSEHWEQMVHRIETGSVTWDDEKKALGEAGRAEVELPDEKQEVDRIIVRNSPDEPGKK